MTELADVAGVKRRVGTAEVTQTVSWRRRVGGKFGPTVDLPAGCISDDTQLRLATSRSMRADGSFDIEAFSKVELTIWPAYALGAGRGSKAAAAGLARRDTTWASNFFDDRGSAYVRGGGNGAAMRIQPHVWAHRMDRPLEPMLRDVLINALCTHGHPRGFLGALLHARCLELALRRRCAPDVDDLRRFVDDFPVAADLLAEDDTVCDLWLRPWEERSGESLLDAVAAVGAECRADIDRLARVDNPDRVRALRQAVDLLDARAPDQRGSGTKTSLLAAFVASRFAGRAEEGVLACANALGTDTDTIATMAGALLGPLAYEAPTGALQDLEYILHEADRMWGISVGAAVPNFPTVDLLTWTPPRTQSDVVGLDGRHLAVAGLGPARTHGQPDAARGRDRGLYEWMTLWFGQSVLVKRRAEPHDLSPHETVRTDRRYLTVSVESPERSSITDGSPTVAAVRQRVGDQGVLLEMRSEPVPRQEAEPVAVPARHDVPRAGQPIEPRAQGDHASITDAERRGFLEEVGRARTLHQVTGVVIRSGFDPEVVGAGLLKTILGSDQGIEHAAAYAGIIGKACVSRRDLLDSSRRQLR